jgi:sec-independent protein translocase protein TatB
VFGLSFSELIVIGLVTLVAVGPTRLPGMLRTFGQWMRKLRKMTTDVRQQTGIDDILRAEGLQGGLSELRGLVRGGHSPMPAPARSANEPYSNLEFDVNQEYPPEGADANGALPDDLMVEDTVEPPVEEPAAAAATTAPAATTATPEATTAPAATTMPKTGTATPAEGASAVPVPSEAANGASNPAPTPAESASDAETARRTP